MRGRPRVTWTRPPTPPRERGATPGARALALALALVGCGAGDPYEAPVNAAPEVYARAVSGLEAEEKLLVNRFRARMRREDVDPVGITMREAVDLQRAHELAQEQKEAQQEAQALAGPTATSGDPIAALLGALATSDPNAGGFQREFSWSWSSGGAAPRTTAPFAGAPTIAKPSDATPGDAQPDDARPDGARPDDARPDDAPRPAPVGSRMTPEMLQRLLQALAEQRMQRDKQRLLLEAIPQHTFDTGQAAALSETLFPQRRVEVLVAFYPQLVDPERFDALAREQLRFPGDLAALARRLEVLGLRAPPSATP
ncbi:MAG: DUF4476 domain-containing protein [Myxococcales bacterium]|nr:DUF4476 domain-containing protein [Myxococcales bacterium]